jgi:membrane fusion protein (multidrug efflux system)
MLKFKPMKTIFRSFILITSVGLLISCGGEEKKPQAAQQRNQAKPYPVTKVPTKTLTAYTSYPASIEGIVNSEVRAKVSGYIDEVLVDEGQKVKKDQILFKLETQSLNQEANAAQASVNAAKVDVDRLKPLVEKDIISKVQLETAKAKLAQAKSQYSSVAANIDYGTIKSPVDGFVGSVRLRTGSLVGPSDQTPLTIVSDISEVYGYFSMNEKDYLTFMQLQNGQTMEQKIDSMPNVRLMLANGTIYKHKGKIETVNSQVNPQTGAVSFRATFDNPERLLTNGNSGKIQIPKVYKNKPVVPVPSTFEQQGKKYVYKVVIKDSTKQRIAASTVIETLAQVGNMYVVKSGVKKGETIVAKGVGQLRNKAPIKPQPKPFDSVAKPLPQSFR